MTASLARVPCTVVTGFLGAGKTTIIRSVLEQAKGKRIAIIVNEFGDIGIDGEILRNCGVENCSDDDIVELANGCICCTVADDFIPALDRILSREPRVEQILIETSGLALPKPLIQAFNWPVIKSRVTVDGVVAVVDGLALAEGRVATDIEVLERQRAEDETLDHDDPIEEVFEDQLACADLVILSKTDLLDEDGLARATSAVGSHLSGTAKIVCGANGNVGFDVLFGFNLAVEYDIDNRKTHHDDELDHEHDDFDSLVVDLPAVASPDELLRKVLAVVQAKDVLRLKGFAHVEGKPMRLLVQAVGPRVTHQYDRTWRAGEERKTRLVVIGLKGMDRAMVEKLLAA